MARLGWFHVTARTRASALELVREDLGGWLWPGLRGVFPEAIAATLMPDHLHMILRSADPIAVRQRLARLLGQLARHFGVGGRARSDVAAPEEIRSRAALSRHVRYVALNPCRKRLAACPLAWPWTTHRDVLGGCIDPWVTAPRLAAALGQPAAGFAARHHAYVSGDPHAHVSGTPLPFPASRAAVPSVGLLAFTEAVAAATRTPVAHVRRRGPSRALFVALAFDQGWGHPELLAEICGCQARAVRGLARSVDPEALAVARLCLGDPRLRRLPPPAPFTPPQTLPRHVSSPVTPSLEPERRASTLRRE